MGQRGPAKKSSDLIKLSDNAGHHIKAEIEDEPTPEIVIPDCPGGLLGEAKLEWFRLTKLLYDQGLICELDVQVVKDYCIAVQMRNDTWDYIRKCVKYEQGTKLTGPAAYFQGRNSQTQSEFNAMKDARNYIMEFAKQFAMTASSRSRIKTFKPIKAKKAGIEAFIDVN